MWMCISRSISKLQLSRYCCRWGKFDAEGFGNLQLLCLHKPLTCRLRNQPGCMFTVHSPLLLANGSLLLCPSLASGNVWNNSVLYPGPSVSDTDACDCLEIP